MLSHERQAITDDQVEMMPLQSAEIDQLATALAKAQGTMNNAAMNKVNPHFKSKYADMGSVLDAIRPPLSANGLSVVQQIQATETGLVLRTILMHSSGQFIAAEYPLPAATTPQAMGSALTYARRYSLAALVCNASDEDDDADDATKDQQDARTRFLSLCEAKIRELDDPRPWLNEDVQMRSIRDLLTPADKARLKTLLADKPKPVEVRGE